MYERIEKPKENRSRAVANSVVQKKSNGKQGFGFVDNRPVSVMQRKVLQLMSEVDLGKMTSTKNQHYFVDPSNSDVLYSKNQVAPPRPIGLYKRSDVKAGENLYVRSWRPNVRLLDNKEKGLYKTGTGTNWKLQYSKNLFNKGTFDLQSEKTTLENPKKEGFGEKLPTKGMLGKNDCLIFASALQNLIAREEPKRANKDEVSETLSVNDPKNKNKISVKVGDTMKHEFKGNANCEHHAATVVAKDDSSLVTLEANVGKSLTKPQFHIRDGVKGFVKDNNTGKGWLGEYDRKLGDSVNISRIGSLTADSVASEKSRLEDKYNDMSEEAYHKKVIKTIGTVETKQGQ